MSFFNTLERRFGWLAFPSIIRYYTLMHVLVFVLQIMRPNLSSLLDFDLSKILAGEFWRIFTCFFSASQFGDLGWFSLIFLFFAVNFMFMINDGLEGEWGAFKTSLFCYTGMACILSANFIFPGLLPNSGLMLYSSAFLAFATLYPKVEVRLFLIIPVQIRILGFVQAGLMLLTCVSTPILFPFYLITTINYFLWAGIPALRGKALQAQSAQRLHRFKSASKGGASKGGSSAFHTCIVCSRDDTTNPELEFRVGEDGNERCSDHLTD